MQIAFSLFWKTKKQGLINDFTLEISFTEYREGLWQLWMYEYNLADFQCVFVKKKKSQQSWNMKNHTLEIKMLQQKTAISDSFPAVIQNETLIQMSF